MNITQQLANMSPLKLALASQQLGAKRALLDAEPIAIIGMGCRFPGANNPQQFWQLLSQAQDLIREVPAERWKIDDYFDADPDKLGKMSSRYGGFVEDATGFDAKFFGLSPREMLNLDPQQRLLLEVSWQALESAYLTNQSLLGSKTGVFVGISSHDYTFKMMQTGHFQQIIDAYFGSGYAASVAAGRISFILGLTGPSIAVDTACSSSLVSVHLACQSLRQRECNMALAGGVNLMLSPELSIAFSKAHMLAPDGRCKTFADDADGYVRGEGCGMIVLKRLVDAVNDGDQILALMRGSSINQDGHSSGLTVPNGPAQQAVIRQALTNSGVEAGQISYVETHGTGTKLGDPIEAIALGEVFQHNKEPLWMGTVKTNIGHLESSAGIAGVIKTILALQHQQIPANLHFNQPSSHIPWSQLALRVPTSNQPWLRGSKRRLAGVSSFGFSGTNAHVILEEAPVLEDKTEATEEIAVRSQHLLALSAKSEAGLVAMAAAYQQALQQDDIDLADICHSHHQYRPALPYRMSYVAATKSAMITQLQQPEPAISLVKDDQAIKLTFLFTGQGAQYFAMAKQLYETQPTFRQYLEQCAHILQAYLPVPLLDVLYNPTHQALLAQTRYTQPALFSIEYALAQVWLEWGIKPDIMIGHSVGEYVAACFAGVFSLEDGLQLIAKRAELMQQLPAGGAMLACQTDVHTIQTLLTEQSFALDIATINADKKVVVSGERTVCEALAAYLTTLDIKTQQLKVSHAFHSALMEPILDEFEQLLTTIDLQPPQLTLCANLTGKLADNSMATSQYWRQHLRQTVRFAENVQTALAEGSQHFIEIGPKPTLLSMVPQGVLCPSLREGQDDWLSLLTSVGRLFQQGIVPDWQAYERYQSVKRVDLPLYPFQHETYWFQTPDDANQHPLLAEPLTIANNDTLFLQLEINATSPSYLQHHAINQQILFPAAGYIDMMLVNGQQHLQKNSLLTDINIQHPLLLTANQTTLQLQIAGDQTSWQIFSATDSASKWQQHITGQLQPLNQKIDESLDITQLQAQYQPMTGQQHYHLCQQRGLNYGESFQGVQQLWLGPQTVLAEINQTIAVSQQMMMPATMLDACLQTTLHLLVDDAHLYLPVYIQQVSSYHPLPATIWCHAVLVSTSSQQMVVDLSLYDERGMLLGEINGFTVQRVKQSIKQNTYQLAWELKQIENQQPITGRWLVFINQKNSPLLAALQQQEITLMTLEAGDTYQQTATGYQLNPYQADDFQQLLAELATDAVSGVIYDWQQSLGLTNCDEQALLQSAAVLHLVQLLCQLPSQPPLYLVSHQSQALGDAAINLADSVLWGLQRVIALEHPELQCRCIDIELDSDGTEVIQALTCQDQEDQIIWRQQQRYVARLITSRQQPETPFQVSITEPGVLTSLELTPLQRHQPQGQELEIEVQAAALNFRDVLNALGMLQAYAQQQGLTVEKQVALGFECVGTVTAMGEAVTTLNVGDAVMVALGDGCLSSHVYAQADQILLKPDNLSTVAAATIPVAFLTAAYGLNHLANIQADERVLIHSAAGGVGLAAVQLAQLAGAEIFATASPGKWDDLRRLGIQHIFNSRNLDFADDILQVTQGQGVQVVLNSLTDGFIDKSFAVLAPQGRFIEIGKMGTWDESKVAELRPDVRYERFDLKIIAAQQPEVFQQIFQPLMPLFDNGQLQPLQHKTFAMPQVVKAFQYMANAKHVGKIILTTQQHQFAILHQASYLITGGLGALGLKVGQWLIDQGATKLCLVGRRVASESVAQQLQQWRQLGVEIQVESLDISDYQATAHLVQQLKRQSLKGVIHAAGVLDDGMMLQQTWQQWQRVMQVKVKGAWHLHQLTLDYDLDLFICFSSLASLLGSAGQSSYAAANSFMDSLAHYRQQLGLPGLSINWGPWADAGMANQTEMRQRFDKMGLSLLKAEPAFATMQHLLDQQVAQAAIADIQWPAFMAQLATVPPALTSYQTKPVANTTVQSSSILTTLQQAPIAQHDALLTQYLQKMLCEVLGMPQNEKIDVQQGFFDIGMDSLTAIELRNNLQASLQHELPSTLAFDYPTLHSLSHYLLAELTLGVDVETAVTPNSSHAVDWHEPIAVIGMSCCFPGGANSPQQFWDILQQGIDTVTEVPDSRWHIADYYDPDPNASGKTYSRHGAFIDQPVAEFDAAFFGISPREASNLDPQHRLLLELSWQAIENSGQSAEALFASTTAVYVGMSNSDYTNLQHASRNLNGYDAYYGTGHSASTAAGRIAYHFGFTGPTVTLDTACSSSLVSVHMACQSLRQGECEQALAAGVNLMLTPEVSIAFAKARMLAEDGHCKTFSQAADGYVRGEGCGVVMLKRLSDAQAAGDNILAVIRGSSVNQDGRSSSLTVPNGPSQQAVIRDALAQAGLQPEQISYIETHGTGTSLGDPIEALALAEVFKQPLWLGAVKTNIGHLESAAGIAGLIKTILALQHEQIPPNLHFAEPSQHIPWDQLALKVPVACENWQSQVPRRAGVSSFGFSGTNAHIVLEQAPSNEQPTVCEAHLPHYILPLSAKTQPALQALIYDYQQQLSQMPDLSLMDICYSAGMTRSHFNQRLAIGCDSMLDLQQKLAELQAAKTPWGILQGETAETSKIAWLFTGQGSQYQQMGKELYETQPVFRQTLTQCNDILNDYLDQSLLDLLYEQTGSDRLEQTRYAQPAIFAIEYALASVWQSWGVIPDIVLGHSLGEYVAACVAGIFSLEQGLYLVAERGRLMQAQNQGMMLSCATDVATMQSLLLAYEGQLSIAAINAENSLVISGQIDACQQVRDQLDAKGIKTKVLAVSHGFHSPLMQPMLAEFEQVLANINFSSPTISICSNLSGEIDTDMSHADYWLQHVMQPVQFANSMQTLHQQQCHVFMEIGVKPTLLGLARTDDPSCLWLPSIRPQQEWSQLLQSVAALYVWGAKLNWQAIYPTGEKVNLPNYPFQHQAYWLPTQTHQTNIAVGSRLPSLLGQKIQSPLVKETIYQAVLADQSLLNDHLVFSQRVVAAATQLEMVLAAARLELGDAIQLHEIMFSQALVVAADQSQSVQLILLPESTGLNFQLISLDDRDQKDPWALHSSGVINADQIANEAIDLNTLQQQCTQQVAIDDFYQKITAHGIQLGTRFQWVTQLWLGQSQALAKLTCPTILQQQAEVWHSGLLDSCFQLLGTCFEAEQQTWVPFRLQKLHCYQQPISSVYVYAILDTENPDVLLGDMVIFNESGVRIADLVGFEARQVSKQALLSQLKTNTDNDWLYELSWQVQSLDTTQTASKTANQWLIVTDDSIRAQALVDALQGYNDTAHIVALADQSEQYQAVLQPSYQGIVYLLAECALDETALLAQQQRIYGNALALIQAILSFPWQNWPTLYLISYSASFIGVAHSDLQCQYATLQGLAKVTNAEQPDLNCVNIDLPSHHSDILRLAEELYYGQLETQIAYVDNSRYVARLDHCQPVIPNEPFALQLSSYGVLDHLQLVPVKRQTPTSRQIEIEVSASALNFRDVLHALGMLENVAETLGIQQASDVPFGFECVGKVVTVGNDVNQFQVNDIVMAGLAMGSLSRYVMVDADCVVHKPNHLTDAEAATIPLAFLTAYYGLIELAQLKAGDKILIHAAAGGVGQAAVQLAQRQGAEIYATASPSKWPHLRKMGVTHLFNSRTLSFKQEIQILSGQGIDVVLNSLNGEFVKNSVDLLAPNARFIELGKIDVWNQSKMAEYRPDIQYYQFDLSDVGNTEPQLIQSMLTTLAAELQQQTLTPLPQQVFSMANVVDAFRYMAQAQHIGKVVITMPTQPQPLNNESTYLITGGLGGLGLQLTEWLIAQGATTLILTARHSANTEVSATLDRLRQQADITVAIADVADKPVMQTLFAEISPQKPLRGIFHAAGILQDNILPNQTWQSSEQVMTAKVLGTWHLHQLSQSLPLDYFVCFSSAAALLGQAGQANYAAANAFMDSVMLQRQALGLAALSINWGPWSDVGMASQINEQDQRRVAKMGVGHIDSQMGWQILANLIQMPEKAQVGVLPIDWSKFSQIRQWPLITKFIETATNTDDGEFLQQLAQAIPSERPALLEYFIQQQIGLILGLGAEHTIGLRERLFDLGIDSLMAVELRNRLKSQLATAFPATLLFNYPTIEALAKYLREEVLTDLFTEETTAEVEDHVADIEDMSEAEAEAKLLEEMAKLNEHGIGL